MSSVQVQFHSAQRVRDLGRALGRIDRAAAKMPSKGRPEMAARAHIKATEDPLGPDDFNVIDHRVWKRGRSQRTAEIK